jgi:RNA polymerase sigma-70 factor, ECF subfamily
MRTRGSALQEPRQARQRELLDDESAAWVRALARAGPERDEAVERLHALLLRAATIEVARRRASAGGAGGKPDDLATQAADDALVAILSKLHTYRGDSRFTTWAYKFALLEAAAAMRRRPWHGRELPLEAEGWARLPDDARASPAGKAETLELIAAIRDAIGEVLTPHQRGVLVALTLNDVPIDVLAERRGTTRNALYKTLHDGRRKLRARLAEDGLEPSPPHVRAPATQALTGNAATTDRTTRSTRPGARRVCSASEKCWS